MSHDLRGIEPFGADVCVGLHVMHAGAVARTGLYQLARVVARPAADHDYDVGLACHLDRRGLPFLGGLADRVEEAHVRLRESPSDQVDQVPHLLYRLRRLGRQAEAWMLLEREHIIVFEHDVEAIEIAGEAAHLHMVALPDDDDVVALACEGRDGAVRDVYERARGFDHRQPQGAGPREGPPGRAVGRHHQGGRRLDVCDVLRERDALRREGAQDGGVVDEVAEDREGAGGSVLERERDGIANAETHAEVGRTEDAHTLQLKVYFGANYVKSVWNWSAARASDAVRPARVLLQAQLLSGSQQGDRFTNAPGARFRPLRCMNPDDEVTPVGGSQLAKEFPRSGIRPQRFGDVDRQVRDDRPWRVGVVRWRGRETGRRQQAGRLEFVKILLYSGQKR